MSLSALSLKGRALRLLAMREHSRSELERRLKAHASDSDDLAGVLDALEAKGLIDARRVVESVVHRRAGKLGVARIRQELQDKGLDAQTVSEAVTRLQETEVERACLVWRKKFGGVSSARAGADQSDAVERSRQIRFLASRGFSGDTIRRVLCGAADADLD